MVHSATSAPSTGDPEDFLLFTPVATPSRATGWTSDKQIAFIECLRRTGVIAKAARSVGMSASAAYQLRKRAGAESGFARAWDVALKEAQLEAMDAVHAQGFEPQREAVWYRGKQVGWRTRGNDRVLIAALRAMDRRSGRFARADRALADFLGGNAAPGNKVTPPRKEIAETP